MATFFRQDLEKAVIWAPTGTLGPWGTPRWRPDNLNSARIDGIEFECVFRVADETELTACYTFMDARQKRSELVNWMTNKMAQSSRWMAYVPRHKGNLGVHCRNLCGVPGLELKADVEYVAKVCQYFDVYAAWPDTSVARERRLLGDYWLAGLRLSQTIENFEIFLTLDNILNEEYSRQFGSNRQDEGYPMPGFSAMLGMEVTFGKDSEEEE